MKQVMIRAWAIRKENGYSMSVALRLAWAEHKGIKGYVFNLENVRAQITAYILKLINQVVRDEHEDHKLAILKAALLTKVDAHGYTVLDGKSVGLCKYAVRNA